MTQDCRKAGHTLRGSLLCDARRLVGALGRAGALLALLSSGAAQAAAPTESPLDLPLLWTADTKTMLWTAATLADVDTDGLDEIIIAGQNQVLAYDGDGAKLWEWPVATRFSTYPAVLLRPGASPLIYVADNVGNLYCLDGAGKEMWRARLDGSCDWQAAMVCDINGDGNAEVIQTDETGGVWAFDALTGQVRWRAAAGEGIGASASVGSLTGAAGLQVAVGSGAGLLTAIGGDGSVLWSRQMGRGLGAPVIFAASDGAGRVVVGSADGLVFCLDARGELLWQRAAGTPIDASISVGDLDLDGRADILLATTGGTVLRLDEDGSVIWRLDTQMRSDASGSIADINGDGKPEYVLCLHTARLLVFDDAGEILLDRDLGINNAYNATPTFGDVSRDSPGLEMVICGGDSAQLFCFATPAPTDAMVQWGGFRRDRTMVGCWPGTSKSTGVAMEPLALAWNTVLAGQGVRFRITGARAERPLRACASCIAPGGTRYALTRDIAAPLQELLLPVEVLAPGAYRFSWSLTDPDGRALVSGTREVTLEPFANDRAAVNHAVSSLDAAANEVEPTLPLSASALRREAQRLRDAAASLAPLQDACLRADGAAQADAVTRTARLVAEAQRAARIAQVVRRAAALGPTASVVAFEGETWNSLAVAQAVPTTVCAPLQIRRRVVRGEHEPVAINLLNITDREVQVRALVEAPAEVVVRLHRAFGVPTSLGEIAWDALPELDESAAISIPSLSTRQLWLDAAVSDNAADECAVTLRLLAIDGAGVLERRSEGAVAPPEATVQVHLDVLPFAMAPSGSFRLCTWAYVESSPSYRDYADATYQDLWEHGNNVFFAPYPEAQYDAHGRPVQAADYTRLDAAVARWQGKDVVLLFQGFPALTPAPGAEGYGSPAYRKALKWYLDDLVAHMASLGVARERFALYPVDEPGGGYGWASLNPAIEFGKMVRAANPQVQIYSNPGGPDNAMMEAIAPYVDIWAPPVNYVATEPEKMRVIRATGKTLWSYNCSYSNYGKALNLLGTLKGGDVVSEYRIAAIWAFRHGLTGAGFWTYCASPEDPWTRNDAEYPMVYPGRTRPVTSRRWEAVREGIEDFRILTALKARADSTDGDALSDVARAQIRRLLEVSVPQFVDGVTDETTLDRLRREMLDCVEAALSGATQTRCDKPR